MFTSQIRQLTLFHLAVDVFPFLKWIPRWVPGAAFKRNAMKSRKDFEEARVLPFQYVQEQMVSSFYLKAFLLFSDIMQGKGTAKPSLASHFLDSINTDAAPDHDRKVKELRSALGNVYLGLSLFSYWRCW